MGASNSSSQTMKFYKLVTDDKTDIPTFARKEKKGDTYEVVESFDTISGILTKIETGSYQYEGKTKQTFKMFFDDDSSDEKFTVESGFSYMTRGMLNSIAGHPNINKVKLTARLYGKTDKKYPTVFVEVNGQRGIWAYKPEQMPKVDEIKNKKGETVSNDYDGLNDFFVNTVIPKINSSIVNEFEVEAEMRSKQPQVKKEFNHAPVEEMVDDGLPF